VNFCSRLSIESHEPYAGTGVMAQAYVFLPVPKRNWHEHEMNRHWASQEDLETIRGARRAGVVVRLYNPPNGNGAPESPAVLVHAGPAGAPPGLERILAQFGRRWRIDLVGRPGLAICTHGTRDRCCAKWGFAAYQAARKLFEAGTSPFEPVECSHLGGDRFAATGIFFPSGSMYAHLGDIDLAALCTTEAGGRIDPATYRGRVFEPQLAQLVRSGLAAAGLLNDATAPIALTPPHAGEVEARVAGQAFRIHLKAAEVDFYGSCAAIGHAKLSRGRRILVDKVERLEAPAGA
jgi:hypothetical protein